MMKMQEMEDTIEHGGENIQFKPSLDDPDADTGNPNLKQKLR